MSVAVEAAITGRQVVWGAPTYDQVRVGWDEARRAAGTAVEFNQSRMTATFPTGGRIIYRSLDDPDNARGHTADLVMVDEAGDVVEVAWYEVLRPMLMDTGGGAWIGGTPKGRNWFWREHVTAADRPDSAVWQVPTLGAVITPGGLVRCPHPLENPAIPFAEIEHLYRTVPERTFRQEILAEFIEDSGGVFRRVSDAATAPYPVDPYIGTFVMGVDWAKSRDFTVLVVLDAASKRVVDFDRFNQIDYHVQRARLKALARTWGVTTILAEQNSIGVPNIEELQRDGLPVRGFQTTNATKGQIIEGLGLAIETGEIAFPNIPQLVAELQAYEMDRLPSGLTRYGAPEGMHDDCVMALALAWEAGGHSVGAPVVGGQRPGLADYRGTYLVGRR